MVQFVGALQGEELIDAYAGADVFAFPSKTESFGIVLVEAACAGLPIVSTRVGVAQELVVEGVTGFTCESCDEDFADKIARVLSNRSFRQQAMNRRENVLRTYDWETITDSLERAYTRVMEG